MAQFPVIVNHLHLMKTKLLFLVVLLAALAGVSQAQKENNVWIFGDKNGMDFNTGSPFLVTSNTYTEEGGASICDASGGLLFYSNGLKIWDKTHNVMPNGSGIDGSPALSSTMGVLFAQVPSDPDLYFMFTVDAKTTKPTRLRYSIIDKRLNGGKGDVVAGAKNIVVQTDSFFSEKMIVVPACGGLWLILHHRDSSIFYSYKITGPTIPAPVKSTTGGIIFPQHYAGGEMKPSPDFSRIILGSLSTAPVFLEPVPRLELFDFDTRTGMVSGRQVIDSVRDVYSVEFSPDGSKLYVAVFNSNMLQYDLSLLPGIAAVYASKYAIAGSNYISAQRGPDGKIYTVRNVAATRISRINDPNKAGAACNVELNVTSLVGTSGPFRVYGNPTAMPYAGNGSVIASRKDTFFCADGSLPYTAVPGRKQYLWNDGDTSRNRTFTTSGLYWISSLRDCDQFIDTLNITVQPRDIVTSFSDTTLCFAMKYVVSAPAASLTYMWNDGATTRDNIFTGSGLKWVTSGNGGCSIRIDSFKVDYIDFEADVKDTLICKGEELVLNAGIPLPATYLWHDGSDQPVFTVREAGIYGVSITVGPCTKKYNINVRQRSFEVDLGADTVICNNNSLTLGSAIDNAHYLWQDGSTGQHITVYQSGTYALQVTSGACVASDTIMVSVSNCSNCIRVPNAFSPNHDQKNDLFRALTFCPVRAFSMMVVNRYGEIIFRTTNAAEGWDGKYRGVDEEVGVYYYLIQVVFDIPGAGEETYKGDVSLIR